MPSSDTPLAAIDCQDLTFAHNTGLEPVLEHVTLELQRGDRCLLVGANGGKLPRAVSLAYVQLESRRSSAFSQASALPRRATARFWVRTCL